MLKTYKYRLYPTKKQIEIMEKQLEQSRYLYNKMLSQRIKLYRKKQVSLKYIHQANQLPLIKDNKPEYKNIHSQVLQNVLKKLDGAFQNFFRRVKKGETPGFPRFKGRNRMDSLIYPQSGFKIEGNRIRFSKIGSVRVKLHREIKGKIKTSTIKRSPSGKWYVCFSVDTQSEPVKKIETTPTVGVDMGIKTFAYLSDGSEIHTEKHLKKRQKKLKREQRKLARKRKGSNNRRKSRGTVCLIHEKVANSRTNFLHQSSRKLVNQFQTIVFEDLKIKNMSGSAKGTIEKPGRKVKQKSGLNRNILDMSWGKFIELVSYKAEEAGKTVVQVNPGNTSQQCSSCGALVKKSLRNRVHHCPFCNLKLDRDHNASINILNKYLSTVGTTGNYACGDMRSVTNSAQEAPAIALA